jgi:hypothetical protein
MAFYRLFPKLCYIAAILSVIADLRVLFDYAVHGTAMGIDLTADMRFQVMAIFLKAILASLQWVAYGVIAALLLRQIERLEAGATEAPDA